MSLITENTIVLPTSSEVTFLQQVAEREQAYSISGLNTIYSDQRIVIYLFDCNGDNPWMLESLPLPWHILEINYLDGDGPYTMTPQDDSPLPCSELLSLFLDDESLLRVRERMRYSV